MRVRKACAERKSFIIYRYVFMMVGIIFLPVLFFFLALFPLGRLFANEDTLLQFYPYAAHLSRALKEGTSLLFTNNLLGGFPLGATMNGGFLHPFHDAIFLLFDWANGYHALTLLYYGGGAIAMYALLRRLGASMAAATFGTVAYLVSQPVLAWVALMPNVHAVWIFPALFFFVHRLSERITPVRDTVALTLILAGSWLAAAPQVAVYAAVAGGCFAIFCDYRKTGLRNIFSILSVGSWRVFFARHATMLRYGIAGFISLLLASPYLLFAQTFNALSNRPALSFAEYHVTAMPLATIIRYVIPSFSVPYAVAASDIAVGFVPLMFAVLALVYAWREQAVRFFGGMSLIALGAALKYSPLMAVLHYIPVFKYFRGPARLSFVAAFALCILAARGFTLLEAESEIRKRIGKWAKVALYGWTGFAALAGLVALAALFMREWALGRITDYFDAHLYARTSQLPLEHYHRVIARYLDEAIGAFSLISPIVLVAVAPTVAALCFIVVMVRRPYRPMVGAVLAFLVFIGGIGGYVTMRPFIPRRAFAAPAIFSYLKEFSKQHGPFRIFSFLPAAEQYRRALLPYPKDRQTHMQFLAEMLAPNAGLIWNIASIDGYDNLMSHDIAEALAYVGSERSTAEKTLVASGETEAKLLETFFERFPLLGRLGVRYIIAARTLEHPSLALMKRFEVTRQRIPVFLYEYAGARPLVEFIHPNDNDQLNLVAYEDALVRFITVTQMPQRIIIRNMFLPGWVAFIDGNAAPLHNTENIFQSVEVPAGEHEVEVKFSYRKALK